MVSAVHWGALGKYGIAMGRVVYKELVGDLCGFYDPDTAAITIDPRLSRQAQVNTLIHEQYHRTLGHGRAPSLAVHVAREVMVERLTANHLIPLPMLLAVLCQYETLVERARALAVSQAILAARIVGLTSDEQLIVDVCARRCIGVKYSPV